MNFSGELKIGIGSEKVGIICVKKVAIVGLF